MSEASRDLGAARSMSADWFTALGANLTGLRGIVFWALLVLVVGSYWPVSWLARRVILRSERAKTPNPLQKILVAWQVLFAAGLPIAAAAAIGAIFEGFGLIDTTQSLPRAIFIAVVRVAVTAGIAQALLAPGRQNWRLVKIDDETCEHVRRTVLAVAVLVSVSRVVESFADAVGASWTAQTMLRGLGAFLAAVVIAASLWIGQAPDDETEEIFGPRTGAAQDWFGLLRIVLWIAVVAILTAVLTGFMGLGRFLVNQIIWVGVVGAVTAMLVVLVDQTARVGLIPTTQFGRSLMLTTGLRRGSFEQLTILLSGVIRVVVFVVAALIALAPWGVQSDDVPAYLHAAFLGFKIGSVTISLSRVVFAFVIFTAGYAATRTVERWLDVNFLPHTRLDQGLRNAIKTSFGYIGRILALGFALGYLGFDFGKLAIVAGALSVGIGFGLQSIVNNFVSGLILLWERAIRVGDWISVGPNEGYVRRINVRSTEIETFDRAAVVIPNSDLVAGIVKNFVRTDRTGRIQISLAVNAAADPEKARKVLLDIAKTNKLVLQKPPPQVVFAEITSAAFRFELYCYIADVGTIANVKSDLNFEIYRRFKAEDLFAAPAPTLVVNLPEIERQGITLKGDGAAKPGRKGMPDG